MKRLNPDIEVFEISAKTGEGTDVLTEKIAEILGRGKKRVSLKIPYSDAGLADLLHSQAEILELDYREDCIMVEAVIKPELWGRVRAYASGGDEE